MKKYIKIPVLLLLTFLGLSSCSEYLDKGNYNYKAINEVSFSGIKKQYIVILNPGGNLPHLKVTPKLTYTKDSQKYSYKWQVFKTEAPIKNDVIKELSTEKNLDVPIDMGLGEYDVYYTVTDISTGVVFQTHFNLSVVNSISEGWLVLSQVGGGSRLDMVSFVNGKANKTLYDILNFQKSKLKLKGSPGFVYTYSMNNLSGNSVYRIYISTSGNGTVRIAPDDFGWDETMRISNEFGFMAVGPREVENLYAVDSNRKYVVKEGTIFLKNTYIYSFFLWDYSPINKGQFKASSYIAGYNNTTGPTIFYDADHRRFRQGANSKAIIPIADPGGVPKFDYNNTGKDLVYMVSNSYNDMEHGSVFAILKDPNDSKYYLAVFSLKDYTQKYYGEITATDFKDATSYAVDPQFGYLFYAVGGKVYQYNYSLPLGSPNKNKLMLDKGSEAITLLKFQRFFNTSNYTNIGRQLVVCSYDPSKPEGANGTMEVYSVPPINGQIVLKDTYTGFGKIKSISFREKKATR